MMNVKAQAAPVQYPVSRTEAKLFCRIPTSNTVEDTLVDLLIASAVNGVEQATGLALTSRKYVGYIDGFPGFPYAAGYAPLFGATPFFGQGAGYFPNGPIGDLGKFPFAVSIPVQPVTAVEKIVYLDVTGAETTLLPGRDFVVDLGSDKVRVGPLPSGSWPLQTTGLSSVRIYFTAGYTTPIISAVTNVAITGNVLTVTATNTSLLSPGMQAALSAFVTATFLNGQTITIATVTATQFTATFTHADYASAADTGTATTTDTCDVIIGGTPTPPQQTTEYKFETGIPQRLKHLLLLMINEGYSTRNISVAGAVGTIPVAAEILSQFTTHDFSVDRT